MLGERPVPSVTTVLNPQAEMQVASTPHLFVTLCSTRYLSEGGVNLVHQQFLSCFATAQCDILKGSFEYIQNMNLSEAG
jgi:hypothetical protein